MNPSNVNFTIFTIWVLLSSTQCIVERDKGVIVLNARNIELEIEKHDIIVIEFYSGECKHCKEFAPKYEELTIKLASLNPPIFTAKIEAEENKELAKKFGVTKVPRLFIYKKKYGVIPYNGSFKVDEIFNHVEFQNSVTNEEISHEQLDDAMENTYQGFVLVGKNQQNELIYNFKSRVYFDGSFYHCPSKVCVDRFNGKDGDIFMFKNKGKTIVKYDKEKLSISELNFFIIKNSLELVENVSEVIVEMFKTQTFPLLILFVHDDHTSYQYNLYKQTMHKALLKYNGQLQGVIAKQGFAGEKFMCGFLGTTPDAYPALFLVEDVFKEKKYRFADFHTKLNLKNMKDFVDRWADKKLSTYVRAQPVPPTQPKFMKLAVRDNFDELVLSSKKDIVLYVFSSFEANSQKVAELLEKDVLSKLKINDSSNPNLEFVVVDYTLNEIDFLKKNVRGLPVLYLLKADDKKKPIGYQGKMIGEDICDFIVANAQHTVEREDL